MRRLFDAFVELIFWLAIFACPLLLTAAIGLIIYISHEELWWLAILICSIGFVFGIFVAERIRRKYGCGAYMARLFSLEND
jgi:uncharacterized membrane protein YfcA